MTAAQERNQRIRIGITGLAFIFLLVIIGTAVTTQGREVDDPIEEAKVEEEAPPADPLTEIGVAPGEGAAPADPEKTVNEKDDALTDALRDDLAEGGAREDIVEE